MELLNKLLNYWWGIWSSYFEGFHFLKNEEQISGFLWVDYNSILDNNIYISLLNSLIFSITLFGIGLVGMLFIRKNIILFMLAVELMLLGVGLNFIFFSIIYTNYFGQIYAVIILIIAASESAIGLGIIIACFRIKKSIKFTKFSSLKG